MGVRFEESICDGARREARPSGGGGDGDDVSVKVDVIRRWAEWLRANPHRQLRGALRRIGPDGTLLRCAVGALDEVPGSDVPFLFSPRDDERILTHVVLMNDDMGWTFAEIAGWLELIAGDALAVDDALQVHSPGDLPPCDPLAGRRR